MSAALVAEAPTIKRVESVSNRLRLGQVSVPHPEQISSYFAAHPQLTEITERVCALAEVELAHEAGLSLELYVDPEVDDEYLTLYVRQPNPDQSIWDKVERIRENYQDDVADLSGWLHVTVDFRSHQN